MTDYLFQTLSTQIAQLQMRCASLEASNAKLSATLQELVDRQVTKNRSSAIFRDMVAEDAYRVLNGDLHNLSHKDAAVVLGLTYAQVYSVRYGYTFKNVHRALRLQGWRTIWTK